MERNENSTPLRKQRTLVRIPLSPRTSFQKLLLVNSTPLLLEPEVHSRSYGSYERRPSRSLSKMLIVSPQRKDQINELIQSPMLHGS